MLITFKLAGQNNTSSTEVKKVRGQRSTSSPSTVEWDVPVTVYINVNGVVWRSAGKWWRATFFVLPGFLVILLQFKTSCWQIYAAMVMQTALFEIIHFVHVVFLYRENFLEFFQSPWKASKTEPKQNCFIFKNNFTSVGVTTFQMWGQAAHVSCISLLVLAS